MLEKDSKIIDEHKLCELDYDDRVNFVTTQVDEYRKILWRDRVDLMLIQKRAELAEGELEKNAYARKFDEAKAQVKEYIFKIETLCALLRELAG